MLAGFRAVAVGGARALRDTSREGPACTRSAAGAAKAGGIVRWLTSSACRHCNDGFDEAMAGALRQSKAKYFIICRSNQVIPKGIRFGLGFLAR